MRKEYLTAKSESGSEGRTLLPGDIDIAHFGDELPTLDESDDDEEGSQTDQTVGTVPGGIGRTRYYRRATAPDARSTVFVDRKSGRWVKPGTEGAMPLTRPQSLRLEATHA